VVFRILPHRFRAKASSGARAGTGLSSRVLPLKTQPTSHRTALLRLELCRSEPLPLILECDIVQGIRNMADLIQEARWASPQEFGLQFQS